MQAPFQAHRILRSGWAQARAYHGGRVANSDPAAGSSVRFGPRVTYQRIERRKAEYQRAALYARALCFPAGICALNSAGGP